MTTTATPRPGDRPGDPKPAFERVAAAWLACEVDQGQRVDPSELAAEVSVTPRTAAATLAALRASRERDPGCARVRMLLARDQIQAAFVAAELRGDGRRLDPDELARQAGVTVTIARQWLRTLRAARASDPTLAELRAEPAEHRPATREQLAELQAAYARGGRPIPGQPPSAEQALERIEQLYRDQEQAQGRRLDLSQVARQVGVGRAYAAQTLAALRGGALTTAQRVEQLWRVVERDGGHYLADADTARMLNLSPARVRQELRRLRTGHRQPAARPADGGRFAWVKQAACRVRQARQPAAARLNGAFLALNPTTTLAVRARNQAELAARVRRAEQEATLSYRVTTELTAENRWPSPSVRAWAIRQRAHHAHQRTRPRTGERRPDRYRSTLERASAHRDSSDGERDGPNEHARRQAARIRERGGAER